MNGMPPPLVCFKKFPGFVYFAGISNFTSTYFVERSSIVVETLFYKREGRGFETQ